jgi:hypothetical protein
MITYDSEMVKKDLIANAIDEYWYDWIDEEYDSSPSVSVQNGIYTVTYSVGVYTPKSWPFSNDCREVIIYIDKNGNREVDLPIVLRPADEIPFQSLGVTFVATGKTKAEAMNSFDSQLVKPLD